MPRKILTGTRIREIRIEFHLKQSELAAKVGISPAYLNLIEHNKRRIGGKLLINIARVLGVDASALSEVAEEQLVLKLRDAAVSADHKIPAKEMVKIDDLARRFPNWCDLLIAQNEKISRLSRLTTELSDRLAHDPFLSESFHDAISTVTAIRSTASILAEPETIDIAIQKRFTENLTQDAERLSDSLEGLVKYFDGPAEPQPDTEVVQNINDALNSSPTILASDPGDPFFDAINMESCDPFALAQKFDMPFSSVLRRIAAFPKSDDIPETGLVICDGAGAFRFQKTIEGFSMPSVGGACTLWPLFQSLLNPQVPIRTVVEMPGLRDVRFLTYAVAEFAPRKDFDAPLVVEATMLILPETHMNLTEQTASRIGVSCRICPRNSCPARGASSILQ